ncbi:MAG: response regulator [Candidatus Neomarinimicrobiota bacterium]
MKQKYIERLGTKIAELESARGRMDTAPEEASDSIRRLAHSLHGSGATYGFPEVSRLAKVVELAETDDLPDTLDHLLHYLHQLSTTGIVERMSILLIEDNEDDALISAAILEPLGHTILIAPSVTRAQELLNENDISLILLDLVLPDMDGRNLLTALKDNSSTTNIPVIVLSSWSSKWVKSECYALGADGYFEKPVDAEILQAAVAAKIRKSRQIKQELRLDVLTGLPNRAAFNDDFQQLQALAVREKLPLSLAMIDLDHFKAVNDQYGHPVGDDVLRYISQTILSVQRKSDILARWGGEEFCLLFYNANPAGGRKALETALTKLKQTPLVTRTGAAIPVTFSAGIAEVGARETVEDVIYRADALLYLAKAAGRERIIIGVDEAVSSSKRILFAEDDDLTAEYVVHRLEKTGFTVKHFSTGHDSLRAGTTEQFDLAILDVKMPGMDGFELLRRLRELPRNKSLPIIMLTSMGRENDIVRGLELGANDYMLKPFSSSELIARVQRLLK